MKTAIIIHGMPSKEEYYDSNFDSASNSHWIPWLQKQLNINNILTQTPEMPFPYSPNYESWKKEFERFDINEDTILVGHSCGAGFLIRYLSENNIKVNKVALVASWINPEKDEVGKDMFDNLVIDEKLLSKVKDLKIFISEDDGKEMLESVGHLQDSILNLKENTFWFKDKGHFTFASMKTREFPELLKYLIS